MGDRRGSGLGECGLQFTANLAQEEIHRPALHDDGEDDDVGGGQQHAAADLEKKDPADVQRRRRDALSGV